MTAAQVSSHLHPGAAHLLHTSLAHPGMPPGITHTNMAHAGIVHTSMAHAGMTHTSMARVGMPPGMAHTSMAQASMAHAGMAQASMAHAGMAQASMAHVGMAQGSPHLLSPSLSGHASVAGTRASPHGMMAHGGTTHGTGTGAYTGMHAGAPHSSAGHAASAPSDAGAPVAPPGGGQTTSELRTALSQPSKLMQQKQLLLQRLQPPPSDAHRFLLEFAAKADAAAAAAAAAADRPPLASPAPGALLDPAVAGGGVRPPMPFYVPHMRAPFPHALPSWLAFAGRGGPRYPGGVYLTDAPGGEAGCGPATQQPSPQPSPRPITPHVLHPSPGAVPPPVAATAVTTGTPQIYLPDRAAADVSTAGGPVDMAQWPASDNMHLLMKVGVARGRGRYGGMEECIIDEDLRCSSRMSLSPFWLRHPVSVPLSAAPLSPRVTPSIPLSPSATR